MPLETRQSIRTPFNGFRSETRILRNGRWVRPNAEQYLLRKLVFGTVQSPLDLRHQLGGALALAKASLGV